MGGGTQDYSLQEMLAELIDERIPGPDSPSIIKSYLEEALALPEGRDLLGIFVGPKTGRTVGTALVERGHALMGHMDKNASRSSSAHGARVPDFIPKGGSLLRFLMDANVRLDAPDRSGSLAVLEGLFDPRRLTGYLKHGAMLSPESLTELFGSTEKPSAYSFLMMDGSCRTVASVRLFNSVFTAWCARLEHSIKIMPGGPGDRVEWLDRAAPHAVGGWVPAIQRLRAIWHEIDMENALPQAHSVRKLRGRI